VAQTVVSRIFAANPDEVWARLRSFPTWHIWLPRIVATTMAPGQEAGPVGSVRTLELSDGSSVRERLIAVDDDARRITYAFEEPCPYPARGYRGSVRVDELTATGGSYVHWSGRFDAELADEEQLRKTFTTVYGVFLDALGAEVDG
jgi:hypothetical protein